MLVSRVDPELKFETIESAVQAQKENPGDNRFFDIEYVKEENDSK